MTDIQKQILQATIQNRNDEQSVSRDMFEVAKQIAIDFADWLKIDENSDSITFEQFISQYNP